MDKLPDFNLKKSGDLSEIDLRLYPVWGAYYEPDDLDALVELGYDRAECEQKLRAVDFSDLYVFPLPLSARNVQLNYLYLAVSAVTKSGHLLSGYRTGPCLCLIRGSSRFFFNRAALDLSRNQAASLASVIGSTGIFPVTLTYVASLTTELFDLSR